MAPNQRVKEENQMDRNLQRFLSLVTQQQLQQQQQQQRRQDRNRVRMGALRGRTMAFAYGGAHSDAMLDAAIDELLDPELRPVPPQPNCPQSMQIFEDHRMMAADYLEVKREISDLQQYKAELQAKLKQADEEAAAEAAAAGTQVMTQEEVEKFAALQSEQEALLQFREKLSTQLELIKRAQAASAAEPPPHAGLPLSPPAPPHNADPPSSHSTGDGWEFIHDQKQHDRDCK